MSVLDQHSKEAEEGISREAGPGSEEGGNEEISAPLVFQCAKCLTIVGDSFSFICSHEDMETITLSASSNIARSADVFTSKEGRDVGSTFFSFTCLKCDSTLGNYYLTTSKDLDEIREKFTFSVKSVLAYHLGKAQHGSLPEPTVPKIDADEYVESSSKHAPTGEDVEGPLSEELVKLQTVMIDMVQRVEFLENKLRFMEGGSRGGVKEGKYVESAKTPGGETSRKRRVSNR